MALATSLGLLLPQQAFAATPASGTWGTCPWTLASNGKLTVRPGKGTDTGYVYDDNGVLRRSYESPWSQWESEITSVAFVAEGGKKVVLPKDCTGLFERFTACKSIDLSGVDSSQVESMMNLFDDCRELSSLNIGALDTSQTTDMYGMFAGCTSLTSLDVSGFDTSKVQNMGDMFAACKSLTSLDVAGFDTSNVENMSGMFASCSSLKSLDLSGFDVSNAGEYNPLLPLSDGEPTEDSELVAAGGTPDFGLCGMFWGCTSLETIDVSGWDVSSCTNLYGLFCDCKSLTSLDLSSWTISPDLAYTGYLYDRCESLATWKIGSGYTMPKSEMVPAATSSNGKWWSQQARAWFTPEEIAKSRGGIADTYTNTATEDALPTQFSDVTSHTSHLEDIAWLADEGISAGWNMPDGTKEFRPNDEVKRGDMAAFLFRLAKRWGLVKESWKATSKQQQAFVDVDASTSHAREIWWLASQGISAGWDTTKGKEFRPLETVKRGDMAAFLQRLAAKASRGGAKGFKATKAQQGAFRDVNGSTAHNNDIWWLAAKGVSSGWDKPSGKEFRPNDPVKRGDMAAFLHRLDSI